MGQTFPYQNKQKGIILGDNLCKEILTKTALKCLMEGQRIPSNTDMSYEMHSRLQSSSAVEFTLLLGILLVRFST